MAKVEIILSEIEFIPVKPQHGLLAFCSFVINGAFCVSDIAIHSRPDGSGYRLVYPTKVLHNGKEIDCFYPINRDASKAIEDQVTKSFRDLQKRAGGHHGAG